MTVLPRADARQLVTLGLGLAIVTAAAWLVLLAGVPVVDSVVVYLAGWTVMMTAMMLPAAVPMILLFRVSRNAGGLRGEGSTALFVAGYLALWTGLGLAALGAQSAFAALPAAWRPAAAAVALAAAGVYQFTPLKAACLRACRSPMDFLASHWRSGAIGPLRLGVDHGIYCLGCCWALVAVLVIVGAMGLPWVTLIALIVFVEKVLPGATAFGRAVGVALVALAALALVRPELVPSLVEVSM